MFTAIALAVFFGAGFAARMFQSQIVEFVKSKLKK